MASTFSIISTVFLTTGVLFFLQGVALVVIYVVKWRAGRPDSDAARDQANMMILFQSMRDLLAEQKHLARQLNEDIDRKLTRINLVVHEALDSSRRAAPRPSSPALPPRDTQRDPRDAFLREAQRVTPATKAPTAEARPPRPAVEEQPRSEPRIDEGFRAVADEAPPEGPTGERFDAWVGLDFADDAPNPYRVEVPERPPASPEDADKARAAFRSLLDMHHETGQTAPEAPRPPLTPGASPATTPQPGADSNGQRKLTPLQRRVHEYSDAGMSVPQISRELGIGKGEVRLILSLREGRKV